MAIERSSAKHGPALDEQMKKEVEGQLRSGRPTRVEEWRDAEPFEDENSPSEQELIERRRVAESGRTESLEPTASGVERGSGAEPADERADQKGS